MTEYERFFRWLRFIKNIDANKLTDDLTDIYYQEYLKEVEDFDNQIKKAETRKKYFK